MDNLNFAQVLESYLIDLSEELTSISDKVMMVLRQTTFSVNGKQIAFPSKTLYLDVLLTTVVKSELTENDFVKMIESIGEKINLNDKYYMNRLDDDGKFGLLYIGTHKNVGIDVFYSKKKHGFIILGEDDKISNFISDSGKMNTYLISWKNACKAFKS